MIKNLQVLRAIAALMVVWVHLGDLLGSLNLKPFGSGGVDLFFVISGFVMVHSTQARVPTPAQFIRNRIARIVPMYWLLTLVVYVIAVFAHSWVKATTDDGVQLAKSLLFFPFRKSNGLVTPVLAVGWTLNYEMFFYALFSLGLLSRHYLRGLACVFAILSVLVVVGLTLHPLGAVAAFYTDPRMLEFGLGMAVGVLTDRTPRHMPNYVRWLMVLSGLCLPGIIVAPLIWPDVMSLITCGLPSVILVTGVVLLERWGWSIESAPLLAVGDASYVLYLSHPYVTVPADRLIMHVLHPTGLLSWAIIGASFALVTLLALVLHMAVERPLTQLAQRLLSTTPLQSRAA